MTDDLPEGTWGYTKHPYLPSYTLWSFSDGEKHEVGEVFDEPAASFICERMNDMPSELARTNERAALAARQDGEWVSCTYGSDFIAFKPRQSGGDEQEQNK